MRRLLILFLFLELFEFPSSLFAQSDQEESSTLEWSLWAPWQDDLSDSLGVSLRFQLPISSDLPAYYPDFSSQSNSLRFSTSHPQASGKPNLAAYAKIPITRDGSLVLDWKPRLQFSSTNYRNSSFQVDSMAVFQGETQYQEWIRANTHINFLWSEFRLGYAIQGNRFFQMEFSISKHFVRLQSTSDLVGELHSHTELQTQEANDLTTFDTDWPMDEFTSYWDSRYSGSAWSAQMDTRLGPVRWIASMGSQVKLSGGYTFHQTLPRVLDSITLESSSMDTDSLMSRATQEQSYDSKASFTFKIPQSHHLQWTPFSFLELNYIYTLNPWALTFNSESNTDAGTTLLPVNDTLHMVRSLQGTIHTTHLGYLRLKSSYFDLIMGNFWSKSSYTSVGDGVYYQSRKGLLQNHAPYLAKLFHRMSPVLSGVIRVPVESLTLSMQLDVLPWTRLSLGVQHAF